jgi:PKD repeat protein
MDIFNARKSKGTITTYAWNFGDGATGSGTVADHSYGSTGSYIVTLTVTDVDGLPDTTNMATKVITVH